MLSKERTHNLAMAALLIALGVFVVRAAGLSADPLPGGPQAGKTETPGKSADGPSEQAPSEGAAKQPDEGFVPSESISADSAVAFPVDI